MLRRPLSLTYRRLLERGPEPGRVATPSGGALRSCSTLNWARNNLVRRIEAILRGPKTIENVLKTVEMALLDIRAGSRERMAPIAWARCQATRSNIPKHVSSKQDQVTENQNHKAIV